METGRHEVSEVEGGEDKTVEEALSAMPSKAALMAAVGVLLANPEVLDDDGLESSLYIFREKLLAGG
jgi:hypothetical protein